MESNLSELSSIEVDSVYIQPHYRESYRLAIYALLCGGVDAYEEFLQAEQVSHFLSNEEIHFILERAKQPAVDEDSGNSDQVSPSTYFPIESDEVVPELEIGWPKIQLEDQTNISLLFHPPRRYTPTIKEVVRKQIQCAEQLVALAMDVFTDVDIFKEIISAALRGVLVYILLDDSRVGSFLNMSRNMGINIHDIKSLRVRTVHGEQYQCRSTAKFHGGLEQRFILVDCKTVLYGTYSYTWSFEKINLSMVVVITGQLVSSFDEEFRRLYARSIIPEALSAGSLMSTYPKSSQLSLNLHMKSRPNMRGSINDRFNDAATLNRGFSVQEMLHQSHFTDTGSLMRGHSYGGDLQKMNSMNRLRMGTKNLGVPLSGISQRNSRDVQQPNRASHQNLKHQTRYGTDHNLIPFNSETSLNKWKLDTYLLQGNIPADAESPVSSPHGSHMGLNEHQSQMIHSRSMNIKSRMEEMRLKRQSLQEHANLRQSQESLRSFHSAAERPQHVRTYRGRPRGVEINPNTENTLSLKDNELFKESDRTEQGLRSASHSKMSADRKTMPVHNYAPAGTDAGSVSKLSESTLKIASLISGGIRHSRVMECVTEMPEEKEALNARGDRFESDKKEMRSEGEKVVQGEHLKKSSLPVESNHHHKADESYGSIQDNIDPPPPKEGNKSRHELSAESGPSAEPQRVSTKKEQKESTDKEKTISRKERQTILKSQNTLDSNLGLLTDLYKTSSLGRLNKKEPSTEMSQQTFLDISTEMSQQQNSLSGLSDTEKRKSLFSKLSSQRSSKRKTTPSADQDQGSTGTPDNEAASGSQVKREKAYSRYELLVSNENIQLDKPGRMKTSDKVKSLSLTRRGDDSQMHQTQGGADNKLGRLMQRMGNLINKNK